MRKNIDSSNKTIETELVRLDIEKVVESNKVPDSVMIGLNPRTKLHV